MRESSASGRGQTGPGRQRGVVIQMPTPKVVRQRRAVRAGMALLGLAFLLVGGLHAFVWGFLVSSVLLYHGSFSINSLAHLIGRRRYATTDDSRNNWLLAILTNGDGWHNNHHHYQSSAKQGFHWWQIDVTYYVLRLLAACGLIWDLRRPPPEVVAQLKA